MMTMGSLHRTVGWGLPLLALLLVISSNVVKGQGVACSADSECAATLRPGSRCVEGLCQNPFYYNGGCLKSLLPESSKFHKTRVCGSSDPPEAEALGFCRPSPLGYTEVRIGPSNWESASLGAWILQILLSEMLEVPVSIEPGNGVARLDFYDPDNRFDYNGINRGSNFEEFEVSNRVQDCRLLPPAADAEDYEACFHVLPEIWWENESWKSGAVAIEPVRELGALGENALFIPRFAATNDTTLDSWLGLQGDANRRKMAETFLTPTTWLDYCQNVTLDNCTAGPDAVAQRPPADETEAASYHVAGLYTGHFRQLEENDCNMNPLTCKGHIADYPCSWTSHVKQQMYHLDIALEGNGPSANGGYAPSLLAQIWSAAAETNSPVIMEWWTPNPLYEAFLGTPAEFTRVLLPPTTQECVDARVFSWQFACDPDAPLNVTVGEPEGACDTVPEVLQKAIGKSLQEISTGTTDEDVFWSPAYDAVVNYKLSNVQLGRIFELWFQRGTDPGNFDPRDAACQWMADNMDLIQTFIPESYPRVVENKESADTVLYEAAFGVAIVVAIMAAVAILLTYHKRRTIVMHYLQKEFFFLLLSGMFLVAGGAVVAVVSPSTAACTSQIWLVDLGYALQLVPLVYRTYEINKLSTSGKHMQRVLLQPRTLFLYVFAFACLVVGFLLAWSIVDAPTEVFSYSLTDEVNEQGDTVVETRNYCGLASDDTIWYVMAWVWRALVLVPGCMLAFMASMVKEDVNDTRSMSLVLYIHLLAVILQVAIAFQTQDSSRSENNAYQSLILSGDTLLALICYCFPKFWDTGKRLDEDPLPDVFVHTTVALVSVDGFAPWASAREPVAVFQFLEKLFQSYESVAEQFNVYKVETVGECYGMWLVAAAQGYLCRIKLN